MSSMYHPQPTPNQTSPDIFSSKAKLGFSIDSIVGVKRERSRSPSPPPHRSPVRIKRSWSPPASPSDYTLTGAASRPRSRSPLRQRSVSPPRQSLSPLLRPNPTSPASLPVSPQTYLDQLASLKALYEAKGQGLPMPPSPLLPPGMMPHGLGGFHRPPTSLHPFLGLQHPMPPREYPLHPWFINRHRFPLGKIFL